MRTLRSGYVRLFSLGISLSISSGLAGCGHSTGAPLSEGDEDLPAARVAKPVEAPIELQTEQMLDPLTDDDVALYLRLMRAAAERVMKPTPADQAALADASKILAAGSAGKVPSQDEVRTLARANQVALAMDQVIADESKIDGRIYRGIVEAVESALHDPPSAVSNHELTPIEKHLSALNALNARFLASNRAEIQKLMGIVRNPANLPK
jgi:hypothetical protein